MPQVRAAVVHFLSRQRGLLKEPLTSQGPPTQSHSYHTPSYHTGPLNWPAGTRSTASNKLLARMRSVAGLQRLLSAPHVRNRLPLLACRPAARKICAKALKTPFEEMSGGNSLILPPDGTPKLDTAQFACKITINALRVPKQRCNELMRRFKG